MDPEASDARQSSLRFSVEGSGSRDNSFIECPATDGPRRDSLDPENYLDHLSENGDHSKLSGCFISSEEKSFEIGAVKEAINYKERRGSGILEKKIKEEDRILMDSSKTDQEKLAYAIELLQHYRYRTKTAESEAQTRASYMEKMEDDISTLSELVQTQRTELFERKRENNEKKIDDDHDEGEKEPAVGEHNLISRADTMGTIFSPEIRASPEEVVSNPSKEVTSSEDPAPAKNLLQMNVLRSKLKMRDKTIKKITASLDTLKTSHAQLRKLLLDREAVIEKLQHQIRELKEWKTHTKEHTISTLKQQIEELEEWKAEHRSSKLHVELMGTSPGKQEDSKANEEIRDHRTAQTSRKGRHRGGESMDLLNLSLLPEQPPRLALSNPTSPEIKKLALRKKAGLRTPNKRIKKPTKPVFTPSKSNFSFSTLYAEAAPKKKGWFW